MRSLTWGPESDNAQENVSGPRALTIGSGYRLRVHSASPSSTRLSAKELSAQPQILTKQLVAQQDEYSCYFEQLLYFPHSLI